MMRADSYMRHTRGEWFEAMGAERLAHRPIPGDVSGLAVTNAPAYRLDGLVDGIRGGDYTWSFSW
jgi:hypothetical protein